MCGPAGDALKVGIIIPAYNEEKRIVKTLDDFIGTVLKKYGKELVLIVVSDNSVDRTNSIIERYSMQYSQIKYITTKEKLGKGGAHELGN